jgi:protocatechuate 3,4-dioxygenase beta subunit
MKRHLERNHLLVASLAIAAGPLAAPAAAGLLDGAIRGTVTDEQGGPIENVCVSAKGAAGEGDAVTSYDGEYEIFLPKGSYVVGFADCQDPARYVAEWWNDRPDEASADAVGVRRLRYTNDVDAVLASLPKPVLEGRVTNEAADPLPNVCVVVSEDPWSWFAGFAFTDEEGDYSVTLEPGSYIIRFVDCNWPQTYVEEWYDDQPTAEQAEVVAFAAGDLVRADAVLAVGGAIEGRVTDASGQGIADVCPEVFTAGGDRGDFTYTEGNGRYRLGALRGGDYKVAFYDCRTSSEPLLEWYDDEADFDHADAVSVTQGETTSGIDAVIDAVTPGSCETDADDDGLDDCEEVAHGTDPYNPDSDGDGFGDGFEVHGGWCAGQHFEGGSDPRDPLSTPVGVGAGGFAPGPLPALTNPICR